MLQTRLADYLEAREALARGGLALIYPALVTGIALTAVIAVLHILGCPVAYRSTSRAGRRCHGSRRH